MIAASVLGLLVTGAQTPKAPPAPTEANLVGEWKGIPNTFKFELNAKGKQDLKKQGANGGSEYKLLLAGLKKEVETMRLTFQADHVLIAKASGSPDAGKGRWTLKGFDITAKMDDGQGSEPTLKFNKDLKKINLGFSIPDFGAGSVELEREKPKAK